MRFYTAEINNKEEILVAFAEGNVACRMSRLQKLVPALNFADMNDLIRNLTAEHKAKLARFAANSDVLSGAEVNLEDVKLCAPIVHPRQDVICLGINYFAHGVEAGHFSEEAFGGERPYTIYFSKRVNKATATGEGIPAYEGLVDSLDYEVE
ncbi:MAG: fumarylacetoacetase, partial [Phascolarctobacterium sp.]|nr:fumarylacetoacetase [Phascolarctobacterium sp.]